MPGANVTIIRETLRQCRAFELPGAQPSPSGTGPRSIDGCSGQCKPIRGKGKALSSGERDEYLEKLAAGIRAGGETGFYEIAAAVGPRLRGFFRASRLSPMDVDDLTEDTLVTVLVGISRGSYKPIGAGLMAWVFQIARNKAAQRQREIIRLPTISLDAHVDRHGETGAGGDNDTANRDASGAEGPAAGTGDADCAEGLPHGPGPTAPLAPGPEQPCDDLPSPRVQALREAITKLSPADQQLIELCIEYADTVDYDQIAAELGIGRSTARVRWFRAKQRLRRVLEDDPRIPKGAPNLNYA